MCINKIRYGRLFIAVALSLWTTSVLALAYHNPTVWVNYFDYSNYTFTYEENGEVKTARLTDPALTPAHQKALLKAVYIDPTIPGTQYGYNYQGYQNRKINYNTWGHQGSNDTGTYWVDATGKEVFPDPNENGMTLLAVQVNENWSTGDHSKYAGDEYFRRAIKSIQLMHNFVRVNDEENPGYLFSIDNTANRFFFLAKGKARYTMTKPFYRLFEQISPVSDTEGGGGKNTDNFIDEMKAGNTFACYHDCTNVLSMNTKDPATGKNVPHWFEISKTHENFSLKNLTIFIPDRRHEDELQRDDYADNYSDANATATQRYFNEYGNSFIQGEEKFELMPHMVLYTVNLEASVAEAETQGYFTIHLNWESAFKGLATNVPEHYYLYQTDGVNHQLVTTIEQPTTATVHDILVPQLADPQTFHFIVRAAPIIFNDDGTIHCDDQGLPIYTINAESVIRTVTVPGKSPFFSESSDCRSEFDIPNQRNIYKNKITVSPTTSQDYIYIKNNPERYHVVRTDEAGHSVTVADVQFMLLDDDPGESVTYTYNYTVQYYPETQEIIADSELHKEEPVTQGTLSGYANAHVPIIDRFTASTATNGQSAFYTYSLGQDSNDDKHSNALTVKVYKTTNDLDYYAYTRDEIMEQDRDRSLKSGCLSVVKFHAINDPLANLDEYAVHCINSKNAITKVGKAENVDNNGTYRLLGTSPDGYLSEEQGQVTVGEDGDEVSVMVKDASNSVSSWYVPAIETIYDPKTYTVNTYGCDRKQQSFPSVTVSHDKLLRSNPFQGPYGKSMGYNVRLIITPKLTAAVNDVYYYRVWRFCENFTAHNPATTLLNDLNSVQNGESYTGATWSCDYNVLHSTEPGKNKVYITDQYIDKARESGQSKKVTYYVRMYASKEDAMGDQLPAPRRVGGDAGEEGRDIIIAEATRTVYYNDNVLTAIDAISDEDYKATVTYYNLTGVASPTPFEGVNIVVTRYGNGTTTSEKKVFCP